MEKTEKRLFVTVYANDWNQCVQVDRVEWKDDALIGYRGANRVVFVNMGAVNAAFVSEQREKKQ